MKSQALLSPLLRAYILFFFFNATHSRTNMMISPVLDPIHLVAASQQPRWQERKEIKQYDHDGPSYPAEPWNTVWKCQNSSSNNSTEHVHRSSEHISYNHENEIKYSDVQAKDTWLRLLSCTFPLARLSTDSRVKPGQPNPMHRNPCDTCFKISHLFSRLEFPWNHSE